jgi:nitroimidazol reductase NimA-like FMN-containing flavoprotein (pyridoxamine 5'-phosphate oxidase superfamily)
MQEAQPTSEFSRVRRVPARAAYDTESVHDALDAALIAHVGFVSEGRAVVIPMLFGRDRDRVYLHGSVASRLQRTLAEGTDVCLTATVLDGFVFARSAFHHSMNYRSVVVFGRAAPVAAGHKSHALRVIAEHLTPGRWDESRAPNDVELKQTSVLELEIEHASAKVRTGGPIDEPEDIDLPIWAGVVPITQHYGAPITDADSAVATPSAAVARLSS